MWPLLKTEMRYHQRSILFSLCFGVALIFGVSLMRWPDDHHDYHGVRKVLFLLTAAFTGILILTEKTEQRIRAFTLLPVPPNRTGGVRLVPVMIIWGIFIVFYLSATLPVEPYPADLILWVTVALTGVVMACESLLQIRLDLPYISIDARVKWMISAFITSFFCLVFIGLPFLGVTDHSWAVFRRYPSITQWIDALFMSWTGALFILLGGFASAAVSIAVFNQRHYYSS